MNRVFYGLSGRQSDNVLLVLMVGVVMMHMVGMMGRGSQKLRGDVVVIRGGQNLVLSPETLLLFNGGLQFKDMLLRLGRCCKTIFFNQT